MAKLEEDHPHSRNLELQIPVMPMEPQKIPLMISALI